jgi:hypothetical protein
VARSWADEGSPLPTGELPALPARSPRPTSGRRWRIRPVHFGLKALAGLAVGYFLVIPLIPGFRKAASDLRDVDPLLLLAGLALEMSALACYSFLTRSALGDSGAHLSAWRLLRIQMSTKAVSSIVPGGSAAGSALGYRLLTLSGVPGKDAGFALATAGLGSAVMLNVIFWIALLVSIPIRGVNPLYGAAALAGIVVMGFVAMLMFGLMEGQGRAERMLRWIARKLRLDEERAAGTVRHLGNRLEDLVSDRRLLGRVAVWAAANWLLDAAALWVFLRAFGGSTDLDGLLVAFGLANILAVIPITPGGIGVIEWALIPTLVGFGLGRSTATLGVASYRIAQFFLPILLGGLLYLSLRVGPWSIERRERLGRLRDVAAEEARRGESRIDFALRFGRRDE